MLANKPPKLAKNAKMGAVKSMVLGLDASCRALAAGISSNVETSNTPNSWIAVAIRATSISISSFLARSVFTPSINANFSSRHRRMRSSLKSKLVIMMMLQIIAVGRMLLELTARMSPNRRLSREN